MDKHIIFGIHVTDRVKNARQVQDLFSEYGCNIRTRIGLHEVNKNRCAPNGVILLEMYGDDAEVFGLKDKLLAIDGVEVQQMTFNR